MAISIHVPSWGTTVLTVIRDGIPVISIHVPSWGTTIRYSSDGMETVFQSTFPRGERLFLLQPGYGSRHFNPRSLVGNDYF